MTAPRHSSLRPSPDSATPRRKKQCPICGALATERDRPFCSARCADVDLNRWLGGVYAIPAAEPEDGPDLDEAPDTQS